MKDKISKLLLTIAVIIVPIYLIFLLIGMIKDVGAEEKKPVVKDQKIERKVGVVERDDSEEDVLEEVIDEIGDAMEKKRSKAKVKVVSKAKPKTKPKATSKNRKPRKTYTKSRSTRTKSYSTRSSRRY